MQKLKITNNAVGKTYTRIIRFLLYLWLNAGAKAFEVGGPNLKVGEPKFFIDFSPEKACHA